MNRMSRSVRVPSKSGTLSDKTVPSRVEHSDLWWGRVPASVLLDPRLSSDAVRIYGMLALSVFEGRIASVGMRQLGKLIGKSAQTVQRRIAELVNAGHLATASGQAGKRAKYELTSPVFAQKQGKVNVVVSSPRGRRLASVRTEEVA